MEMKWFVITTSLVGLLMFPLLPVGQAASVGDGRLPGVTDAMLKADFWTAKLPASRQLILDPAGIAAFNRAIYAALPQAVVDLDAFPDTVGRASLRQWLAADRLPRSRWQQPAHHKPAPQVFVVASELQSDGHGGLPCYELLRRAATSATRWP